MYIITHGSILYNAQIAYGLIEIFIIIIIIINVYFVPDGLWEIIYHGKRIYLFMATNNYIIIYTLRTAFKDASGLDG